MGVIRLEPTAPRIVDQQWKREVAGSCLVWDPLRLTLSFAPPERRPDRGWNLDVRPGQAQAIVHVTGAWPNEMFGVSIVDFTVDAYAFVDIDGRLLVPGLRSGVVDLFPGWFPPARVRALAGTVGIEYREDRVENWSDLNSRYDGLVDRGTVLARVARVNSVVLAVLGTLAALAGVAMTVAVAVTGHWEAVVPPLILVGMGARLLFAASQLRRGHGIATRRHAPAVRG